MNKTRRAALELLAEQVRELDGKISDLREQIEMIRDEEQEYFDNMPESFQNGEKGDMAQEAISNLENAIDMLIDLNECADYLINECADYLTGAAE